MTQPSKPAGAKPMERLLYGVKKIIVGRDHLLERLVVALLARGHILVEGVPGLAKTMAIKTLAEAIGGEFRRIQFTPDLVPADLVGARICNQKTGEFNTALGPVFTNLLLADEINRAPAKVQSALLEVMQERQVTIGARDVSRCRARSWCWPPRTRSRPRAPTRSPRRRSTALCSRCWSATRAPPKSLADHQAHDRPDPGACRWC